MDAKRAPSSEGGFGRHPAGSDSGDGAPRRTAFRDPDGGVRRPRRRRRAASARSRPAGSASPSRRRPSRPSPRAPSASGTRTPISSGSTSRRCSACAKAWTRTRCAWRRLTRPARFHHDRGLRAARGGDRGPPSARRGERLAPLLALPQRLHRADASSPSGTAHIDVAWLWPLAETERKAARTLLQPARPDRGVSRLQVPAEPAAPLPDGQAALSGALRSGSSRP